MIRHAVMFKFKDTTSNEDRKAFVGMLNQLAVDIEQVRQLEVGENFADSPRAFDVLLLVDVNDEDALQAYASHPDHQPVIKRAGEICEVSHVVDYPLPG